MCDPTVITSYSYHNKAAVLQDLPMASFASLLPYLYTLIASLSALIIGGKYLMGALYFFYVQSIKKYVK